MEIELAGADPTILGTVDLTQALTSSLKYESNLMAAGLPAWNHGKSHDGRRQFVRNGFAVGRPPVLRG